jgi:hypothetical protein
MSTPRRGIVIPLFFLAVLLGAPRVASRVLPSSDLLLPYFEIGLAGGPPSTLFALANGSAEAVEVTATLQSNWGIGVLSVPLRLEAGEVRTVNLRDWIVSGRLPDGNLAAGDLAHVQAALTGRPSPRDGLYYSSAAGPGLAVGSMTFRVAGSPRPDALWGDFLVIDARRGFAASQSLASLDRAPGPPETCARHGVRFLAGEGIGTVTELRVWTGRQAGPSPDPELPSASRIAASLEVHDEAGWLLGSHALELPPLASLDVAALTAGEPFGWIDLVTATESFVMARVLGDEAAFDFMLSPVCLPARPAPLGPSLRLEPLAAGRATRVLPGPSVPVGSMMSWSYIVTNDGDVPLSGIRVQDDQGLVAVCPADTLDLGEMMTCDGAGLAQACQRQVVVTVVGEPPSGPPVVVPETAWYFGGTAGPVEINFEMLINGEPADDPAGLMVGAGQQLFVYCAVQNTGAVALQGLSVTGRSGQVAYCPRAELGAGEWMGCYFDWIAEEGIEEVMASATAVTACGQTVTGQDSGLVYGAPPSTHRIGIVALVEGVNARGWPSPAPTVAAGSTITFSYVVVNSGQRNFFSVTVRDEKGNLIPCPLANLAPGQSMTCTRTAVALPGWQIGSAAAYGLISMYLPQPGSAGHYATASDWYFYFGAVP